MMQAKVGPTVPPGTGASARPPVKRSISATLRYSFFRVFHLLALISGGTTCQSFGVGKPHQNL